MQNEDSHSFFAKIISFLNVSAPCNATDDCSPNQEDMYCNDRTKAIFFSHCFADACDAVPFLSSSLLLSCPMLVMLAWNCVLEGPRASCTWCVFIADCKGKEAVNRPPSVSCENLDIWTCTLRARKQLERHQSIFFVSRLPDAQGCPSQFWAGINTQYLMRRPIIQADLWKPSRSRQALFPFQHVESYSSPVSYCVCQAKQVATVQYKIVFQIWTTQLKV